MKLSKFLFLVIFGLFPLLGTAMTQWDILSNQSSIRFTATQNNAPIQGEFKQFAGKIQFDPKDLAHSKIEMTVNTGSIFASYNDIVDLLKTPEWLNTKVFPTATFTSSRIIQMGSKDYQVEGTLTIRDKTLPIAFDFTFVEFSDTAVRAEGDVVLNRTAFGVGQGEWSKTEEIKDKVVVKFILSAKALKT